MDDRGPERSPPLASPDASSRLPAITVLPARDDALPMVGSRTVDIRSRPDARLQGRKPVYVV